MARPPSKPVLILGIVQEPQAFPVLLLEQQSVETQFFQDYFAILKHAHAEPAHQSNDFSKC